ncbi:MAG: hypothetical protein J0H55_10240 [Chitinophagaceae bacterium]|nr:hypothetical protein [Chitinophagaceae bacterium]
MQRQIEELGKALGMVVSKLYRIEGSGDLESVIKVSVQELKTKSDLDIQKLLDIPSENFIKILSARKDFNHDNLDQLANLFLLFADKTTVYDQRKLYEKSLVILDFLENDEKVYSFERRSKIAEIKKRLEESGKGIR